MSGNSIAYKLMTILLIICMIVVPVFTDRLFDKLLVIMFLICILPWVIASIFVDIKDSSELETKIKFLEDRVKELEDKNK